MDKISQPLTGRSTPKPTFADKCSIIDKFFLNNKLTEIQIEVPYAGFILASPIAYVKHILRPEDENSPLFYMKLVWRYDRLSKTFIRELRQELPKPLNMHMVMTKLSGFNYRIRTKENVVISRLIVNIRDIDESVNTLIDEANRFLILYCQAL
jgi:hypothetical protein